MTPLAGVRASRELREDLPVPLAPSVSAGHRDGSEQRALCVAARWRLCLPAQRKTNVYRMLSDARLNLNFIGRDQNPVHNEWAMYISETFLHV